MAIDYRKDLEKAARQMILIHRADILIKLILRTIVKTVKVSHAGMLIYDKIKDEYVVRASRGFGFKIPPGFAKIKKDNPLINYFVNPKSYFPKEAIIESKIDNFLKSVKVNKNVKIKKFLRDLKFNLYLCEACICIPVFFRQDLIGVLFLGEKINHKKFTDEEIGFLSVLASNVAMALKNAWLIEDLNKQIDLNKRLFLQTVSALASSIEAKDKYTMGHTERVARYALDIANTLRKSPRIDNWNKFIEDLRIAALLHDIGKIGIPGRILNKRDVLKDNEREIIKRHPLIGTNILDHIEGFKDALLGVKYHHERYDGGGYPSQLKGKQIPLIASIISLADTFDAMTIDRPYRKSLPIEKAVSEIKRNKGKQFSPVIVGAFLKTYHLWQNESENKG